MAMYHKQRAQPSAPEPEYDNLEVRCTWSGEYEELSDVRITLDVSLVFTLVSPSPHLILRVFLLQVKCEPNTQLQLLNLRGPGIFLEEYLLERVSESEDDTDGQEDAGTPQSPLFGFSPLAHRDDPEDGDGLDAPDDIVFERYPSPVPAARSVSEESEDTLADSEDTQLVYNIEDAEILTRDTMDLTSAARTPSCSPETVPKGFNRPRKRSATDAELPDSGSDTDERGGVLKDVTHRKARQLNSIESPSQATPSAITSQRDIALPKSPKKSTPTKIPGSNAANENAKPRSPEKTPDTEATLTEKPKISGQSPQKSSFIPRPTSTSPLKSPLPTSFAETAVGYHLANKNASENHAPVSESTRASPIKENKVRFELPSETKKASRNGQSPSPSRSKKLETDLGGLRAASSGIDNEKDSNEESKADDFGQFIRHGGHDRNKAPEPSDQPELKPIDGLLMLKNSQRVRPATFKVTITAVLFIMYPTKQGWSDFELPGIPKTGGGKIGIILFLLPAEHGLEIRTTNVNRASIVENCLIAEFVNAGNLIVPLRRCSRDSCGEISDFTVDQEICSLNKANPAVNSNKDDKSAIEMDCHAVCFIRLYNRLFWSERCVIPLYVDGGPEGFFHCDLTTQPRRMKKIVIRAREGTRMGVSRVQVTCSPKDIGRLYVRWTMEFTGLKAAYWIPRIYSAYSTSHELERHRLRNALLDVLNDLSYQHAEVETTEVDCDEDSKYSEIYEDVESLAEAENEDAKERPLQPAKSWQILSRFGHAVKLHVLRYGQNINHFLKMVLIGILCLVFLRLGFAIASHVEQILSLMQAPYHVSEETSQSLPQETSANLNVLELINEHQTINAGLIEPDSEETKLSVEMGVDAVEDVAAEKSATFRDRIDYWLGWTGPA